MVSVGRARGFFSRVHSSGGAYNDICGASRSRYLRMLYSWGLKKSSETNWPQILFDNPALVHGTSFLFYCRIQIPDLCYISWKFFQSIRIFHVQRRAQLQQKIQLIAVIKMRESFAVNQARFDGIIIESVWLTCENVTSQTSGSSWASECCCCYVFAHYRYHYQHLFIQIFGARISDHSQIWLVGASSNI